MPNDKKNENANEKKEKIINSDALYHALSKNKFKIALAISVVAVLIVAFVLVSPQGIQIGAKPDVAVQPIQTAEQASDRLDSATSQLLSTNAELDKAIQTLSKK